MLAENHRLKLSDHAENIPNHKRAKHGVTNISLRNENSGSHQEDTLVPHPDKIFVEKYLTCKWLAESDCRKKHLPASSQMFENMS